MFQRLALSALLCATLSTSTFADTTIIFDDFESYTTNSELLTAWPVNPSTRPDNGTILTTDALGAYGGFIQGQAAEFCGSVNDGDGQGTCGGPAGGGTVNERTFPSIAPSATQNIELSYDLGDDALSANMRMTVGLRGVSGADTENIIEMGLYNAGTLGYSYRAILFPALPSEPNPNWVEYGDAALMDMPLADELNSQTEVGAGFHTYKAVISVDKIVFSLDLYADGKTNDPLNPVRGEGTDGVDAMDTVPILAVSPFGFTNLRFGIPSQLPSSGGFNPDAAFAAFDNISLKLVDVVAPAGNADFDGNGLVDGNDFLIWQRNFGLTGAATPMDGDANGDQNVDAADLGFWQTQYGTSPAVVANLAAVPEPASACAVAAVAGGPRGLQTPLNRPASRRLDLLPASWCWGSPWRGFF